MFAAVHGKLGKTTFWTVLGLLITVLLVVGGAMGGLALGHCMNGNIHIDERYPLVTKEVFAEFKLEQERRFTEVIEEIRKANGGQ